MLTCPSKGQLLAELQGNINFDEFKHVLLKALEGSACNDSANPVSQSVDVAGSNHPAESSSVNTQRTSFSTTDPSVQTMLDERRRRLEIDKRDKEAAEKAEHRAKQEAQRAAAEPDSRLAKQHKYAQLQKKRELAERQERERILKVIENDKVERKRKEHMRKALAAAQVERDTNDGAEGLVDQQLSTGLTQPRARPSDTCAVQVRLFDGSKIRATFNSDQTLRKNVRQWIDEQRVDGDVPYTFRQILTPLPNKPISILDEEESLQTLGLTPSATLVMVPVQTYSAAYDAGQGYLAKGLSAGYNMVSGGIGLVTGAVGTFLGVGNGTTATRQTEPTTRGATQANPTESRPGINIRTLRNRRTSRDEQQLYNGNQVSLQSRIFLQILIEAS